MFKDAWDQKVAQDRQSARALVKEHKDIAKNIKTLTDRILTSSSPSVVSAYEAKIEELEKQARLIEEKQASSPQTSDTLGKFLELTLRFIANPWKIWGKADLKLRRTLLRLAFQEPLIYCKEKGFRTPEISFPFKALQDIQNSFGEMVAVQGLEPRTRGL